MRMMVPPVKERRVIQKHLEAFFREHRASDFNRAISAICRFYRLRRPRVEWFEYLDWGRTAGRTYENGKIHLVHPENWKRNRKYNSERQWVNAVYHEMGHYVFWADAERKADRFAYLMEKGVANGNGASRPAGSSAGRGAARSAPRRRSRAAGPAPRRKVA